MNGYGMIRTFGVVVLLVAASVLSGSDAQMKPLLTADELASISHLTTDKPPQHVITSIRNKREDGSRVRFSNRGKWIDSHYNPSPGKLIGENTPVWLASTNTNGTTEYWKLAAGIVGKVTSEFFTRAKDLTTLAVSPTKSGDPSFDGKIGDLIIRPLQVASPPVDASKVNGSTEKTIYPSLLVQTYYKGVKTRINDIDYYDEILYQVAFWNAVNLPFRFVDDPRIIPRIAGIIIGLDRSAILGKSNAGKTETLNAMRTHWYSMMNHTDLPHKAYDIVMTMTDAEIYEDPSSIFGPSQLYLKGIGEKSFCMPPSEGKYHAVGIFPDNHAFNGIPHAAYTLGSILGLSEDPYFGDECGGPLGFIMSPLGPSLHSYMKWSPCTLETLPIELKQVNCADKPAEFHPPGRAVQLPLPGDIWTAEKQCKVKGFDGAIGENLTESSAEICQYLTCYNINTSSSEGMDVQTLFERPAVGTRCGPGHKCVGEDCVDMSAEHMYCKV